MAFFDIKNVRIAGISAAVPKQKKDIAHLPFFAEGEAERVMSLTGIRESRIVTEGMTCSDLCYAAADKLLSELNWERDTIDLVVYVPMSRDYYVCPMTANVLQSRLGLSKECMAFDLPLACSGFVYGLAVASNLLQSGNIKRALLFNGETTSFVQSPEDKTIWPLHGDGGTVTALEYSNDAEPMKIHVASDGNRSDAIINPVGGMRNPYKEDSFVMKTIEDGVRRNDTHAILQGMDVFSFAITDAPKSIKSLAAHFDIDLSIADYYLIHQANQYIIEKIARKLNAPADKVPISLDEYGNISSGTIPLTIVTRLRAQAMSQKLQLLGVGFGAGLSWGSAWFATDKIVIPELIEL